MIKWVEFDYSCKYDHATKMRSLEMLPPQLQVFAGLQEIPALIVCRVRMHTGRVQPDGDAGLRPWARHLVPCTVRRPAPCSLHLAPC